MQTLAVDHCSIWLANTLAGISAFMCGRLDRYPAPVLDAIK